MHRSIFAATALAAITPYAHAIQIDPASPAILPPDSLVPGTALTCTSRTAEGIQTLRVTGGRSAGITVPTFGDLRTKFSVDLDLPNGTEGSLHIQDGLNPIGGAEIPVVRDGERMAIVGYSYVYSTVIRNTTLWNGLNPNSHFAVTPTPRGAAPSGLASDEVKVRIGTPEFERIFSTLFAQPLDTVEIRSPSFFVYLREGNGYAAGEGRLLLPARHISPRDILASNGDNLEGIAEIARFDCRINRYAE